MSSSRYDRMLKWMLSIVGIFLVVMIVSLFRLPTSESWQKGDGPRVGVVKIEGIILDSERIVRQLNEFSQRKDIEAILVRINSPGGAVAASQEIYAKLCQIRDEQAKPVIASLGMVAASASA